MDKIFIFSAFLLLSACGTDSSADKKSEIDKRKDEVKSDGYLSNAEIKRFVEGQLRIPANENYTMHVFEAQLNEDTVLDKIITVNLLDRAMNEAIQNKKTAKQEELGYMGNYNFFFYVDGESQKITSPIVVPSSAKANLRVEFTNLLSDANQDIMIDLRIKGSCFRRYYSIMNKVPVQVSETEVFLDLGTETQQLFYIQHEPNNQLAGKNIVVYEGVLKKAPTTDELSDYTYFPDIQSSEKLIRRWYFSPQHMKYYLRKDEIRE